MKTPGSPERRWLRSLGTGVLFAAALLLPVGAADKSRLTLRAAPSTGSASTVFVFQGHLTGVRDSEEFYCLTAEWFWDEQADSSLNEFECAPFVPGKTKIDRVFSEEQSFRRAGPHRVRLVLRKGEREVASAVTTVTVRP